MVGANAQWTTERFPVSGMRRFVTLGNSNQVYPRRGGSKMEERWGDNWKGIAVAR